MPKCIVLCSSLLDGSGVFQRAEKGATRATPRLCWRHSEVELIDVVLDESEGLPEEDVVARLYRISFWWILQQIVGASVSLVVRWDVERINRAGRVGK